MKLFAQLFKKYRLRSEFETIASFSDALAEKGYIYEESIFYHWQKGTRIPTNRELVLTLIEIFKERDAIKTIDEANEFLSSVGLGYVTDKEEKQLCLKKKSDAPFQVPNEVAHFTGRKELLADIQKELKNGKIVLLHGSPGVGKTALAIQLGHVLRDTFSDGVLWYKVDSTNSMDILLSIARLFNEDIHEIKDIEVRASVVRTLLATKKVLLIFDNVTKKDKLYLLLPNGSLSSVLFTSQENTFPFGKQSIAFSINNFTQQEVLALFQKVFDKKYVHANKKAILSIGEKVGNLPLAVNIVATHSKQFTLTPQEYLRRLEEESFDLQLLEYEDKNLLQAVGIAFTALPLPAQTVFSSLGIFEAKDFSLEAVAFINKLPIRKTEQLLQQLLAIAFLERSKIGRYRIHPLLKLFARRRIKDTTIYLRAAIYYEQLLLLAQEKKSYRSLTQEVDNVIYVFKKCYEYGYWDQLITLWNPLEQFLSDTNEIKKMRILMDTIDTSPNINILQKVFSLYMFFILAYWILLFFSGLKTSFWNHFFGLLWGMIPLLGGLIGILRSKSWGLFRTQIGKAIFFTSVGLFSWAMGSPIWFYYAFFQRIAVPYPSPADVGFFMAGISWIVGIIYFSKATGAKITLKQIRSRLFLLVVPTVVMIFLSYFFFCVTKHTFYSDDLLKIFLDLAYPFIDTIILSIAIIIFGLSVNFFRGKYKLSLFVILAGFIGMYIADFTFSYTNSLGIYYDGSLYELLFAIALYLLTWGTLSFYLTPKRK